MLTDKQATLAVAESCTGGLISHLLTQLPGSSAYFLMGAVTYANAAKIDLLGVLPETLASRGAVDEQTAMEMARGARSAAGADYALSTTGIAGPDGGTAEKPVGTVCIGLATPEGCTAKRYTFKFAERSMNKKMFAVTALNRLRLALLSLDND